MLQRLRCVALCALSVLLSGCGGGGGPTAPDAGQPAPFLEGRWVASDLYLGKYQNIRLGGKTLAITLRPHNRAVIEDNYERYGELQEGRWWYDTGLVTVWVDDITCWEYTWAADEATASAAFLAYQHCYPDYYNGTMTKVP